MEDIKITYILGAGASAKVLPISKNVTNSKIKHLPTEMSNLASNLEKMIPEYSIHNFLKNFKLDLLWLAKKCDEFDTVDTFAKYCYLTKRDDLTKVKLALSTYFVLEQGYFKKFDKRYIVFLTTLLQKKIFPSNIKVLTWNYDYQMELACNYYQKEEFHYLGGGAHKTTPLAEYYPAIGYENIINDNQEIHSYSIVHLNGIAGFNQYANNIINTYFQHSEKNELLNAINQSYKLDESELLSFGWEERPHNSIRNRINIAKEIIKDSNILVIIGYSFPFFNRIIDKEILNILKGNDLRKPLKKIYFQDPVLDGQFLREQFNLDSEIEIKHIPNTDQFFVPYEL